MKRSKSFSLINVDNPEISYNPTIKSLNVRASYIPNYSQVKITKNIVKYLITAVKKKILIKNI